MHPYVLLTDSSCDVSRELLDSWNVKYLSLTHHFEDDPDKEYRNDNYPIGRFYEEVRNGRIAKTSAVEKDAFLDFFRNTLESGKDVLYLAFSSGLSATYEHAVIASQEIAADYPERKILICDTRSASAGMGLLVYLTSLKVNEGAEIEEAYSFAQDMRFRICHWFTVNDLKYLKRGGRVSAAAAFVGGVLSIKPVLHMDDPGHLIPMTKVTGRKNSIIKMADKYGELAVDPKDGTVFISHGDCRDDAEYLASLLKERYGVSVKLITYVGPVIGAHSGPGTLALFFVGTQR